MIQSRNLRDPGIDRHPRIPMWIPGGLALACLLAVMLAPAASAAPRSPEACPQQSTTDTWDQSAGVTITDDTGFGAGVGLNMFGAELSSAEPGFTFFRDDQADGFVHRVEWATTEPVTIRSFVLRAAHDHNQPQRSFKSFTLKGEAESGELEVLYTFEPELPYGFGDAANQLVLCDDIASPLLASHFVAEFVQNGGYTFPGPRIIELDGFETTLAPVATPTPEATAEPVTAAPTEPAATDVPVATPAATPTPSDPAGGSGDMTLLIGAGALVAAAVVALWFIVGRRRRQEDRTEG